MRLMLLLLLPLVLANPIYLPLLQTPLGTPNLAVDFAGYLGGAGADAASAVEIAPDNTLLVAGTVSTTFAGIPVTTLPGGTTGSLLRLDGTTGAPRAQLRIGTTVTDLDIATDGAPLVCGDFGVAAVLPDLSGTRWTAALGNITRCSMGSDGTSAALLGGNVFVHAPDGTLLRSFAVAGSVRNDLVVDGANARVIVTGYSQRDVAGFCSGQLQVAFVRAYTYNGDLSWTAYDQSAAAAGGANLCADTRGERLAIGRDGLLYFAASINGGTGASIVARDPQDIGLDPGARNVARDDYNRATNVGSVKMTWFGRYNPQTGALLLGSSLLTRLSNSRGNSIVAKTLMADAQGRVYLAGDTACCSEARDTRRVAGQTVGTYEGGEAFLAVLSADMTTRLVWTPFAATGAKAGGSPAVGVAVRGDRAALVATFAPTPGRAMITSVGPQTAPGGAADMYVVGWRTD